MFNFPVLRLQVNITMFVFIAKMEREETLCDIKNVTDRILKNGDLCCEVSTLIEYIEYVEARGVVGDNDLYTTKEVLRLIA